MEAKDCKRRAVGPCESQLRLLTGVVSKRGSYPPAETRRGEPCQQVLAGMNKTCEFSQAGTFKGSGIILGMWPEAASNYVSVGSSL